MDPAIELLRTQRWISIAQPLHSRNTPSASTAPWCATVHFNASECFHNNNNNNIWWGVLSQNPVMIDRHLRGGPGNLDHLVLFKGTLKRKNGFIDKLHSESSNAIRFTITSSLILVKIEVKALWKMFKICAWHQKLQNLFFVFSPHWLRWSSYARSMASTNDKVLYSYWLGAT